MEGSFQRLLKGCVLLRFGGLDGKALWLLVRSLEDFFELSILCCFVGSPTLVTGLKKRDSSIPNSQE